MPGDCVPSVVIAPLLVTNAPLAWPPLPPVPPIPMAAAALAVGVMLTVPVMAKPPLPPRADENAYEKPLARSEGRMLPGDLSAALDRFESDAYLRERLGASVSTAYLKLKRDEWRRFLAHHSAWEVENAMDL